jgi:hypothetical protein
MVRNGGNSPMTATLSEAKGLAPQAGILRFAQNDKYRMAVY